jgi:hypothetical protein
MKLIIAARSGMHHWPIGLLAQGIQARQDGIEQTAFA